MRVFRAAADELTDVRPDWSRDAYDLDGLAARYHEFLDRWDRRRHAGRSPTRSARGCSLVAEWLQAIRRDPRLPVQHLPAGLAGGAGAEDVPPTWRPPSTVRRGRLAGARCSTRVPTKPYIDDCLRPSRWQDGISSYGHPT